MDISTEPWRQLTDRIWVTRCAPVGANAGLVVGDDQALLIDAGATPAQGRILADSAARIAQRPVKHLAITHWHWDHWFGAAGVGATRIFGHEELIRLASDAEVVAEAERLEVSPAEIIPPTDSLSLARSIDLGGVRVEFLHFGRAHTSSDLIVSIPCQNTIFAGDLLEQGADPQFGADTAIGSWIKVLTCVLELSTPETVFVPGHGQPVNQIAAAEQRHHLIQLLDLTEELIRKGVALEDAANSASWPFGSDTVDAALPLAWAELSGAGVSYRRELPLA